MHRLSNFQTCFSERLDKYNEDSLAICLQNFGENYFLSGHNHSIFVWKL